MVVFLMFFCILSARILLKYGKKLCTKSDKYMYKIEYQLKVEDFVFPYGKLNKENRLVKFASIINLDEIENKYCTAFANNNGCPAKNVRIALGSIIIKQKLVCSDEETVEFIAEKPYLQYFIELKEYQDAALLKLSGKLVMN